MNSRSKAAVGSLALLIVVACGRTEDESNGGAGGPAGGAAGSGVVASGGKLGGSGSSPGGATGKGGAAGQGGTTGKGGGGRGGGSGEGNAANTGGSPDAGAGGTGDGSVPLSEGSWDTTLALTITKAPSGAILRCTGASFTLHVSPEGGNLKAISGRDGAVLTGELIGTQNGASYSVAQPLPVPTGSGCDLNSIGITELKLQGWDETDDGVADRIGGSGKASGTFIQGDLGFTVEFTFTLQGVPDATKPSFLAPSLLHPLDGIYLRATEPVALTSSATISDTGAGGTSYPLSGYTESAGAFGYFSSALILPFGSSWKLSATGGDLAHLPFDLAAFSAIAVLADPGLFAQDGFESSPALTLTGSAKIVTSVGVLPAISGNKSLFVPPGSSATLHLARPTSASKIRYTGRGLMSASGSAAGGGSDVLAGVIGGSVRVQASAAVPTTAPTTTNDSTWMYAGPAQEITMPLTEDGADVVIRFAPQACMGFCPAPRALLVDDLRLE